MLPSPRHFEQASTLVTPDAVGGAFADRAGPEPHIKAFRDYAEAGFDEIYLSQIGGSRPGTGIDGFFTFYRDQVLPVVRA